MLKRLHFPTTAACAAVHGCVSAGGKRGSIIRHVCQWGLDLANSGRVLTQSCTETVTGTISMSPCQVPVRQWEPGCTCVLRC